MAKEPDLIESMRSYDIQVTQTWLFKVKGVASDTALIECVKATKNQQPTSLEANVLRVEAT